MTVPVSNHRHASLESGDPLTTQFGVALRDALRPIHDEHSTAEIHSPSPAGAFPADMVGPSFLVVADACRLRDDILYACRHGRRTTLITAANEGDIRVFCARHVVDEVFEHAREWSSQAAVPVDDFLGRWHKEYLAVIRVVDADADLAELLSPAERSRVDQLQGVDPDDVPSATLAVLLEGFYLSNDTRALRAAYGERLDLEAHGRWLQLLRAGSDAGQLSRMGRAGLGLVGELGAGAYNGTRRLIRVTGRWLPLVAGLAAVVAVARISPERRRRVLDGTSAAIGVWLDVQVAHAQLVQDLRSATQSGPDWAILSATIGSERVLARACLHTLARSQDSNLSAAKLARQLPTLDVAQSATKVRTVLRGMDCFSEVWRGYWQVGRGDEVFDHEPSAGVTDTDTVPPAEAVTEVVRDKKP